MDATLLHPWALALMPLSLVAIFLLHLRSQSARPVIAPALFLLPPEDPGGGIRSRSLVPQRPWLLALRLLIAAALSFSVAGLVLRFGPEPHMVLVMDACPAMAGTGVGEALAQRGEARLRGWEGPVSLVVASGARPRIVARGVSGHEALARLRGLELPSGQGLAPALSLARRLASGGEVMLLTACPRPEVALLPWVRAVEVAPGPDRAVIESLAFGAHPNLARQGYFLVSLRSPQGGFDGRLRLEVDGREVASRPLSLTAGEATQVSLPYEGPGAAGAKAVLEPLDALAANNQAYACLPDLGEVTVVLAGRPSADLRAAFEALPLVRVMEGEADLAVFLGSYDPEVRARAVVLFDPPRQPPFGRGEERGRFRMLPVPPAPFLAALDLDRTLLGRVGPWVDLEGQVQAIEAESGRPLITVTTLQGRPTAIVAFDPHLATLPAGGLAVLAINMVDELVIRGRRDRCGQGVAGQAVRLGALPEGAKVTINGQDDRLASAGRVPTDGLAPGVYALRWEGGEGMMAINAAQDVSPLEVASLLTPGPDGHGEQFPLWPLILALGLVLAALEPRVEAYPQR